ncbi:hypothetical protein PT974_09075 [Cladobotryum mycophilum]|uniref:F-box domain-containing protein n=1 Tax=Cladobotryum mycophilum TaxID=491253 RepID=A0ABR0SF53_9HYPO
MSAAASGILAAPELVELILLELDPRTLLTSASRVSRQWKGVIDTSPSIQKKLFFQPMQTDAESSAAQDANARLRDLFQPTRKDSRHARMSTQLAPGMWPWGNREATPDFTRSCASWRRMLVQQPATMSFGQVIMRRRLDGTVTTKVGKADTPDGLRLGQLWDALRENMVNLKSDLCFMQLFRWDPSLGSSGSSLFPMSQDVNRLFEQGAQLVLTICFTECKPTDRFYGKSVGEYEALCRCEDFEPLDFGWSENVAMSSLPRRRPRNVARAMGAVRG